MSIFRTIFALEILSFIKVSSFRLVKEIEVGISRHFDFLVFMPSGASCVGCLFSRRTFRMVKSVFTAIPAVVCFYVKNAFRGIRRRKMPLRERICNLLLIQDLLNNLKIFLKKFKKYLHGTISRIIFALEILSFIKVSSFRLVKEIEVGVKPSLRFSCFMPAGLFT